ncbi:MAG: type II toxin-antitoxin system death-on-curing family toxin [Bacillota bacterium]
MKEPIWLTRDIIETIHLDLIRVHGGHLGYRDENLVEAALAGPLHRWDYDPDSDLPTLAAAYGFAFAKNHGFTDGNKRVAFMAMYVFLGLNGYEITAPEPEVVNIIQQLSSGHLTERDLADWLRTSIIAL